MYWWNDPDDFRYRGPRKTNFEKYKESLSWGGGLVYEVKIENERLSEDHVRTLCRMISEKGTVRRIKLHDCDLSDKSIKYIATLISSSKQLEEVTLSDNYSITAEGEKLLSKAATKSNSLRTLFVNRTDLITHNNQNAEHKRHHKWR